jgi:hypothetical protein
VADNVAPVVKVADYSGEKPLLNKPIVTLSNPQVNNASEKVVSPVVKAPVNKLVKRQINTITPKAEKLTDNTKISPVVKKDSATRYYKYPVAVQPTN